MSQIEFQKRQNSSKKVNKTSDLNSIFPISITKECNKNNSFLDQKQNIRSSINESSNNIITSSQKKIDFFYNQDSSLFKKENSKLFCSQQKNNFTSINHENTSAIISKIENQNHISLRGKSQGIEKIIKPKYLPQLVYDSIHKKNIQKNGQQIENNNTFTEEYINENLIDGTLQKKTTFPDNLQEILELKNCITPKKQTLNNNQDQEEIQLLDDDSRSDASEKSNNNAKDIDTDNIDESSEDSIDSKHSNKNLQETQNSQDEKKNQQNYMNELALKHGFQIQQDKNNDDPFGYEAASKWILTQEMLEEMKKKDLKNLLASMYVPPPLEILKRVYINKEPVKTGFNMGLLPIKIKNNFEIGRFSQGPQIIVKHSSNIQKRQTRDIQKSTEKNNKNRLRSSSNEIGQMEFIKDSQNINPALEQNKLDEDVEVVQQILQQTPNNEASLKHFFYLEYKKNFDEGKCNPIVYSKYGKQSYISNENFDNNNFNHLNRICNLKKLFKSKELNGTLIGNKDHRNSEPISFPTQDYYKPKDKNDKTLVFESRFESGNLHLAHKVSDNEYDLILQNDINSRGHTQWFYFRVQNGKKGMKVKFNMLNLMKADSLYNDGMKVLIYSDKRQEYINQNDENQNNLGWIRGGEDLSYYQNNYKKEHQQNFQRCYYTFTFSYIFEYDMDNVYFAYSQPYTYTDLLEDLCEIQQQQLNYVTRNTLCRTIAGNKCEYLSITNRSSFEVDQKKQGVVITARIHPGESNSSFMMKGVINFLISNDPKAVKLRDNYVFKIIPMLNPDGVINGNYRCSLAGCDLNRRWKFPSEILHPTVYHTKQLILKLAKERPLALYCDLHGHSRKKNIFMYGNIMEENDEASRIFPFLMSKIAQPHFSYDYSRFSNGKSKEHTARVAIWRELSQKHANIFTMESSFCGPKPVKYEPHRNNKKGFTNNELNYHFNTKDFMDIGQKLCETLILYKQEQDCMTLVNIEQQIEEYHSERVSKIEQEELIKQQQLIFGQRKIQDFQNRVRTTSNFGNEMSNVNQVNQNINNVNEKSKLQNNQSAEKTKYQNLSSSKKPQVRKIKTEIQYIVNGPSVQNLQELQKKKKIQYKSKYQNDESDAVSNSEPSEDNLDDKEIMKLIPKKFGKAKYLKGIDEIKKKKEKPQEAPRQPKKPKAQLMPCMSNKKDKDQKDLKDVKNVKNASVNKQPMINSAIKEISFKINNNGKKRDVKTQIEYKGDGMNLALMELDILKHTGCKWSKIIYPGYKGVYIQNIIKSPINNLQLKQNKQSGNSLSIQNNQNLDFASNFNQEFNKLKNSENLEVGQGLQISNNIYQEKQQNNISPFSNEHIIQQTYNYEHMNNISSGSAIKNLQQKIIDCNFSEPRSLFGGYNINNSNKKNELINKSSSKKSKILGLPFEYNNSDIKVKNYDKIFNQFDQILETVEEKLADKKENFKSSNDYQNISQQKNQDLNIYQDQRQKKNFSTNNQCKNLITKKIIDGEIVAQQNNYIVGGGIISDNLNLRLQKEIPVYNQNLNSRVKTIQIQKNSIDDSYINPSLQVKVSLSGHKNPSFTNLGQYILNSSADITQQKYQSNGKIQSVNPFQLNDNIVPHSIKNQQQFKFSDIANVAPSSMLKQIDKITNNIQRNSLQGIYQ